jgi:UDP-glucose 4-epimerase
MTWLVTGGAGYIGRHVVAAMLTAGLPVVVVDDLSAGDPATLPVRVPLIRCRVTDTGALVRTMRSHRVTGVMHLAARKSVPESVLNPLAYYRTNVTGTAAVAEAMTRAGVGRLVHASSAAVYGPAGPAPVTEDHHTAPANPYGRTKLTAEELVRDAAAAHGIGYVNLRLFNVAGATGPGMRDVAAAGLVPRTIDALVAGRRPVLFGAHHPTADGSCVRDYVHVADVARAHVLAAEALAAGRCAPVYNVGSGVGVSVLEALRCIRDVTGIRLPPRVLPAPAGEVSAMVASTARIRENLGWVPRHTLADAVRDEWWARVPVAVRETCPDAVPHAETGLPVAVTA